MSGRFELYPSIDIRDGKVVRLLRGDFGAETVYGDDPVAVAREFAAAGAEWIHVVDLDAARTGEPVNLRAIEAICAVVPCKIQTGGGVRSAETAGELLHSGVARVVIGTAAVENPELVAEISGAHPGKVAVGLDARGREVAVRGWTHASGGDVVALARRFEDSGAAALVVTQIRVDGTLEGPDFELLDLVLGATAVTVVASGGVGTLDDLRGLAAHRNAETGRTVGGAIVGRAIYEGRVTVGAALQAVAG